MLPDPFAFVSTRLNTLRRRLGLVLAACVVMLNLLAIAAVPAHAQFSSEGCAAEPLSIAALISPGNYFPLIPASCGVDAAGNAIPLSIQVIPDILIRAYGAITSLVLYFGMFYLIYAGILWITSGLDSSQKGKAIKAIQTATVSIILVLSAHIIVNTIVIILGIGSYAEMGVAQFFTTNP